MGKQVWSAVCTLEQGAPYFDNYARREQEIFFRFVSAFHELTITLDQSVIVIMLGQRTWLLLLLRLLETGEGLLRGELIVGREVEVKRPAAGGKGVGEQVQCVPQTGRWLAEWELSKLARWQWDAKVEKGMGTDLKGYKRLVNFLPVHWEQI